MQPIYLGLFLKNSLMQIYCLEINLNVIVKHQTIKPLCHQPHKVCDYIAEIHQNICKSMFVCETCGKHIDYPNLWLKMVLNKKMKNKYKLSYIFTYSEWRRFVSRPWLQNQRFKWWA